MKCNINESLNSLSLILIPINVNGNRHMFLLDTGSQQNGVSDASAECMKCFEPSGNLMSTQGLDGHTIVTPIGQMSYEIGPHTCKAEFFITSGITIDSITDETGIEIDGLEEREMLVRSGIGCDGARLESKRPSFTTRIVSHAP